ncbi:N-acetylglucosamine-6-phosphate deacetylase [Leucobacter sp. UT-8R-CII-1-4]|uniref:N-acetylglucosamine-6-phosphate deacetylase n=1 Tax=Leucobacter sp. UT-8R-CII-1-4 TaxID=3040075 RepID=UPI0024A83E5A|nr:N-acetylglucosamine-6-phosphate deacetylase [Leucobacter sp. UT-8R-CII-1-4]MDI6022548.1 N-acetylglucosamine-6-phosphate deacetylase [Leucobacter sp. UT-8R-CII-1-4]
MSEVLVASKVVTSSGVHAPGWLRIEDGHIVEVGAGAFAGEHENTRDLGDVTIVPGFVDAHVHGGGGSAYPEVGPTELAAAIVARDAHLARGTTATIASLVTAQPEELLAQVTALAPLVAGGALRGIHLEGPWLNPAKKGAHDERALRTPDLAEIDALLAAGGGAIRMVTIAPELPGALDAIERLVEAGVVVAIGHTDADFDQTKRAIEAGATVATHLFNAMPPLLHREPGPVLALLEDERVMLELVADGVHLHPELVAWVEHSAGAKRVMLVTDAMGAAACGDGAYRLGALEVTVADGVAKIAGTETIAGSTATMDALFRQRAIQRTLENVTDEALVAAVMLTATNPARAMGWADIGDISPGKRADLVVLDKNLQTEAVFLAGKQLKVS